MRPPILLYADGSFDFFKSVAEAERYAEPIDVQNHEYVAYDSEGRRLELRVEEETVTGWLGLGKTVREHVRIVPAEDTATHADELKNLLQDFLPKLGGPTDSLHTATLHDLIAAGTQRMGFTR
jgi:hypothetical protein